MVGALESRWGRALGLFPLGIVRMVYPGLTSKLWLAAAHNVHLHLAKLRADGRARSLSLVPFRLSVFGLRLDQLLTRWWLAPGIAGRL